MITKIEERVTVRETVENKSGSKTASITNWRDGFRIVMWDWKPANCLPSIRTSDEVPTLAEARKIAKKFTS